MKGQNATQPCRDKHVGIFQNFRIPKPMGLTPRIQGLDPQRTETGPPEGQGHRTRHPGRGPKTLRDLGLHVTQDFVRPRTSWDSRLHETRDFVGFKPSQDLGLREIQDFAEPRTSWDLGLYRKQELFTPCTSILFCGVLQENTNFLDKFKSMDTTWYKVSK